MFKGVTRGHSRLYGVTWRYKELQVVRAGYRWSARVTRGNKGSQGASTGYRELEGL